MELKEFVSDTLKQIIDGIIDAQKYAGGKGTIIVPYSEQQKSVSFDVAVTVDESKQKEGKAGVTVWSIGGGISGKTESSSSIVSRIKFDVPIELPEGIKRKRPEDLQESTFE